MDIALAFIVGLLIGFTVCAAITLHIGKRAYTRLQDSISDWIVRGGK